MTNDLQNDTARLLQLAGPRPEVPADRLARVRAAVHGEWHAVSRRRVVRRRVAVGTGVLAAAAAVLLGVRFTTLRDDRAVEVATVVRAEGRALTPGAIVRAGDWLETGASDRAALQLRDATSIRMDASSRARLISPTTIELVRGALYLDTGPQSTGLEVRTPLGVARDIGTQFEVRVAENTLRLRVRTGVVELHRDGQISPARSGTEVLMTTTGATIRPVSIHGPDWDWAAGLAPAFDIEGRTLDAFLRQLAREKGWTLRYADAALAREASGNLLHGSVSDIQPDEALRVVLAISGLAHKLDNGELVVLKPDAPK